MKLYQFIGLCIGELARHSAAGLAASREVVACAECGSDSTRQWSARQPCCGRTLCARCVSYAVVFRWDDRVVVRCDHCQSADTFCFGA